MAIRRLINIIEGLTVNRDSQGIRNDQQSGVLTTQVATDFLIRARVESVSQSNVVISTEQGSTTAALATDEPLQAGQNVWAIKADDGTFLVLGSTGAA